MYSPAYPSLIVMHVGGESFYALTQWIGGMNSGLVQYSPLIQKVSIFNSECMKCILTYCGGSISLHCNFWHVIFDAWPRELDWELK